jgi:tetratricopeptide (TPR) repeat protein
MKNGLLPITYYLSPILIIGLVYVVVRTRRYTNKIIFGSLFFVINTIMILGLLPVAGPAIVADRYIYVASVGLFFLVAEGIYWCYKAQKKNAPAIRYVLILFVVGIISTCSIITWRRCRIWKNSMTLWHDVLSKYQYIPEAFNGRGLAFYDNGEYARAIDDFNRTIALNPLYVKAYYNRANTYDALQDYDRAIVDYSKTIDLDPNYSKAYNNRGLVYSRQGRVETAISDFTKALSINPFYTSAYNNRGLTYGRMGKWDRAIEDFTIAVKIDPTYTNALYNRAVTYYRMGQFSKALQDVKRMEALGESVNPAFKEALRQALSH